MPCPLEVMISGTSKADQGAAHNQCNDQAQTDLYAREAAGKFLYVHAGKAH